MGTSVPSVVGHTLGSIDGTHKVRLAGSASRCRQHHGFAVASHKGCSIVCRVGTVASTHGDADIAVEVFIQVDDHFVPRLVYIVASVGVETHGTDLCSSGTCDGCLLHKAKGITDKLPVVGLRVLNLHVDDKLRIVLGRVHGIVERESVPYGEQCIAGTDGKLILQCLPLCSTTVVANTNGFMETGIGGEIAEIVACFCSGTGTLDDKTVHVVALSAVFT